MRFHSQLIIVVMVLLLTSCTAPVVTPTATATLAPTPTSGVDTCLVTAKSYKPGSLPPGRIAFNCYNDPNVINIYTFDTTTGIITNLTHNGFTNSDIQWSPDGWQIAFFSNLDSRPGTYLVNADGSATKWLSDGGPSRWSPDGKRIAFMRDDGLYVMNSDGGQQVQLANNLYYHMAWSPDTKRLAFAAKQDGVHIINADGTQEVKLTDYSADFGDVVWSPDKNHIYFLSTHAGPLALYSIDISGNQPQQLASPNTDIIFFAASPDGNKIAFYDGNGTVSVMNSDGSQIRQLFDNPTNHLSWSPDSRYLAFAYGQLAVVKVDTGQVITLTETSDTVAYPQWSPK